VSKHELCPCISVAEEKITVLKIEYDLFDGDALKKIYAYLDLAYPGLWSRSGLIGNMGGLIKPPTRTLIVHVKQ